MTESGPDPIRLHLDPDMFREALNFTAAETAFLSRLIEKDYFSTVLLQYLSSLSNELVFRGGTCLAKVHAGFYRLSEDIYYVISTPIDSTRRQRSRSVEWMKEALGDIENQLDVIHLVTPVTGANNSTQYTAVIGYQSILNRQEEKLKIEVGLREPLLTPGIVGSAQTLLRNPVSGQAMVPAVKVMTIAKLEALAEKVRAALTRREVAIRDFFDVDYFIHRLGVDMEDMELISLVRKKLTMPGNDPVDISPKRLAELRLQLDSQLKPVLRAQDFVVFDLDRAFTTVARIAAAVG